MAFDVSKMLKPDVYDHPANSIELIETHISWVVLTGDYAYKVKKPVNFGFLDFSTLDKRHECCDRELVLNSRLAADIYLDVVAIHDNEEGLLSVSGKGRIVEYAVKMRQFSQSSQLDNMLHQQELKSGHIDAIARMVADFHQSIPVAEISTEFGSDESVYQPVKENLQQIKEHINTVPYSDVLSELELWSKNEFHHLQEVFRYRKRDGFIRECHGDMHLRNLIWLHGKPMAFDCIEFNDNLRWIDVISEVAFLVMDLQDRKQDLLASRFLNTYLEFTGDYNGLQVLSYYLCYRALVRAKVDALRYEQEADHGISDQGVMKEFESYLSLAESYTQKIEPVMVIMRGVSASGKSTVSQQLVDRLGMVRIRSDVERKRLFGVPLSENASSGVDAGIYTAEASEKTYEKLLELSRSIVDAGYSVIVDAVFLKYEHRLPFEELAGSLEIPCMVAETTAPESVLKQRIVARQGDVSDADLAVLEHQLAGYQPLHENELNAALTIDTTNELDIDSLIEKINAFSRLQ